MRYTGVLVLCVVIFMLSGCGVTARSVFEGGYATGVTASTVGKPLIHQHCMEVAKQCGNEGLDICDPLTKCQEQKHVFVATIVSLHRASLMGLLALSTGDTKTISGWVDKVEVRTAQLAKLARELKLDTL